MKTSHLEEARLEIAHLRVDERTDLAVPFGRITKVSAETLSVGRVGIWFFAGDRRSILCDAQYVEGRVEAASHERLDLESCPAYREALESRRVVVATDASTDPITRELGSYLASRGVGALLDAPVFLGGEQCGVICHEHVGGPRAWTEREVAFAISVADMVGALLESARRVEAELALRRVEADRSREQIVSLEAARSALEEERDALRDEVFPIHGFEGIIGESPSLRRALEMLAAVAETDATTLLLGESGVGKEILAAALHEASSRARRPFVRVNCAAIPHELYESEFFGHARGAFTGAVRDRRGRFELAHGGTLFLDEVADIPPSAQASLLRALQDGTYSRVGEESVRTADVRVVAATNKDLDEEIRAGRFREDLFYRLAVFPIPVPPLRERAEDIVPLARHFLARSAEKLRRTGLTFSNADEKRLLAYPWPGNVRELQNIVERAVILSPSPPLRLDLAWPWIRARTVATAAAPRTKQDLAEAERNALAVALREAGGRIGGPDGAASRVGLAPSTFRDRVKSLGMDRPSATRRRKGRG